MPLPSQLASGAHTWRDYIIDFTPTERDFAYYTQWMEANTPTDAGCLLSLIEAEWKISITPGSNPMLPWLALTCRRTGHYLQGFTISPKGVGVDACLSFAYWLVFTIIGMVSDDIDGFLTYGSGWESNDAGKAEISTNDEIPF